MSKSPEEIKAEPTQEIISQEPIVEVEPVTLGTLDASQLAVILNADKTILRSIGTICFRRCIPSFEKEFLNEAE